MGEEKLGVARSGSSGRGDTSLDLCFCEVLFMRCLGVLCVMCLSVGKGDLLCNLMRKESVVVVCVGVLRGCFCVFTRCLQFVTLWNCCSFYASVWMIWVSLFYY